MAKGSRPTPRNLYSFSRVKTYHHCPARYRYRYLQGMAEAFRSIESFVGQSVHAALEWLYRERTAGRQPTRAGAAEALDADWAARWGEDVAIVRAAGDIVRYRDGAHSMVARFFQGVFHRDRSETLALEQRVSFRIDDRLRFTGVVDRVGRTAGGRLFVVDYKTSTTVGDRSDFSEGLQAPLYAACQLDRHDADEAMAGYHYVRHGTTSWHRVDRAHASRTVARFACLASEAATASDFPPRPGPLCAWCGFNHRCPEARVPDHLAGGLRLARTAAENASPGKAAVDTPVASADADRTSP